MAFLASHHNYEEWLREEDLESVVVKEVVVDGLLSAIIFGKLLHLGISIEVDILDDIGSSVAPSCHYRSVFEVASNDLLLFLLVLHSFDQIHDCLPAVLLGHELVQVVNQDCCGVLGHVGRGFETWDCHQVLLL